MSKSFTKSGIHVGFSQDLYFGNNDNGFCVKKDETGITKYDETNKCLSVELDVVQSTRLHNIRYVIQVSKNEIYPLNPVEINDIGILVIFNKDVNDFIRRGTVGRTYKGDIVDTIVVKIENNQIDTGKFTCYHTIDKHDLGIISKSPNQELIKESKPKKLSDFRSPTEIRIQWMKLIGMEEDEILENIINDPAISVEEEEEQFDSALRFYNIGR